jgi:hypothetical protein
MIAKDRAPVRVEKWIFRRLQPAAKFLLQPSGLVRFSGYLANRSMASPNMRRFPTSMDDPLVENVAADLSYLRSGWGASVDDDTLRRDTAVLRRLLVEGDLQRAWKAAGFEKEPVVECRSLDPVAFRIPPTDVVFASAGGGIYGGAWFGGANVFTGISKEGVDALRTGAGREQIMLGLRKFTESPCILIGAQSISRRTVIKYVANKAGGVHFDPSRKQTPEELQFSMLDSASKNLGMLDKNAVNFELLSTGQALGRAKDVEAFITRIKGSCPPLSYRVPELSPPKQ